MEVSGLSDRKKLVGHVEIYKGECVVVKKE